MVRVGLELHSEGAGVELASDITLGIPWPLRCSVSVSVVGAPSSPADLLGTGLPKTTLLWSFSMYILASVPTLASV